ncbi:ATP-binding cassette domain-containing protein [Pseudokineococcus marinus]|uniref:Sugar ABC transporter ATP-binding protein n=1 Tax=Pseudokineococcus marinus TaxID=351215 RepID=A0A849BLC3_9ACTN|nr:ATP-binding cassette domain-containing protein [Pseudokineococcus marinus]NNH21602.1 sugar ABC transporter ATP-binding protein [Pseudokineococcus marinus]
MSSPTTTAPRPTGPSEPTGDVLLRARGVSLSFGSVRALKDVDLDLRAGEITAIVGDNGAGKSTFVKCVAGVHRPDDGTIELGGDAVSFRDPQEAREAGIETVHQSLALVEDLAVWQNLYLNRELTKGVGPFRVLDRRGMRAGARDMVSGLSVNVPSTTSRVRRLSGGQRQAVAICRAAGFSSRLVIMDEPTAALGVQETERVEALIRRLRDDGRAVLLVSHNFEQVMRLSDQVWVMRSGRCAAGRRTEDTTGEEIVALITGAKSA